MALIRGGLTSGALTRTSSPSSPGQKTDKPGKSSTFPLQRRRPRSDASRRAVLLVRFVLLYVLQVPHSRS